MKRWLIRLVKFVVGLVAALVLATVVLWWLTKPEPPDAFYKAGGTMPAAPGVILKTEPFSRDVPDNARGWRILYTTTRFDGSIAAASAIVLAPKVPSGLPSDVIAWTHGTTGVDPACAPSVLAEPFANVPGVREAIAQGWVIVATDYIGQGTEGPHPYLIGEGQARSALDSLRALRQMKDVSVTDKTVVWGHSQGGNAAIWTGILAPVYAPEQKILGIAAAAPASDLVGLVEKAANTGVGRILSAYIITAYSSTYPDVKFEEVVRPGAAFLTKDISERCMAGKKALFMVLESAVIGGSVFAVPPGSGALGRRLLENTPSGPLSVPLLIAQGETDALVLPEIQDGFVSQICSAGRSLEYTRYSGRDHLTLVANDSPFAADLIQWSRDRIENKTAPQGCTRTSK